MPIGDQLAQFIFSGLTTGSIYALIGKAMRATSFNPRAAALMGVNVNRMILLSFALSGALGAVAGITLFPWLMPNPYYLNVVNIIGLNTLIVVGLNLLIGYAGQISLGHAAFYGLGAYLSGILTVSYGVSPWLAMLLALIATGFIALLIGIPTLKLHGHYLVMATLGFNIIINIITIQWDQMTGGPSG
ncbi:MAG: hypothetical protein V2B13_11500, partial [Pseudomonadota bacterium]